MAKYLVVFLFTIFILNSCKNTHIDSTKYQPLTTLLYIDVVEKKINENIYINSPYSDLTKKLLINWLSNDIKTNGHEGHVEINILDITNEEYYNDSNLIIKISAKIELSIHKLVMDSHKKILISGYEYGELKGAFTLNDKKIEIENIIIKLIEKFNNQLLIELN
jgi:hypothetical protein